MNTFYDRPCLNNFYRQAFTEPQSQYKPGNAMGAPTTQVIPTFPLPQIGTTLPTGMPAGTSMAAPPNIANLPGNELVPQTVQSTAFLPGFLKTKIGTKVKVEFLIGTTGTTDRTGTLVGVGASYILIRVENTDEIMLCDLYSIKFVTFYHQA